MLVLKLKAEDAVTITLPDGREAQVKLVDYQLTRQIRVGFDFPQDVRIMREKALAKIRESQA